MRIKLNKLHVKHVVEPLVGVEKKPRAYKNGAKDPEALAMAKAIVNEICGLAPYEKKATDMIKRDQDKKCKKFLKKRLGSLRMARRKQEKLAEMARE